MALDCLLSTAELYKLCMDARLVAELSIPHHGAWERVLGAGVPEMPARTHILSAPWAAKQAMERWLRHRTALATISRLFSPLFALSCLINLNNSGVQAGSTVERACVLQSYTLLFEALEAPIAIPEGHMGRELSLGEGGHAQGRVGGWGASLLCGCKVVMYSSEGGPWDMRDGITKQSREGQPGQEQAPIMADPKTATMRWALVACTLASVLPVVESFNAQHRPRTSRGPPMPRARTPAPVSLATATMVPLAGATIANTMFFSGLPEVLEKRKLGSLGDFNPMPMPIIFGNCFGWLTYSLLTHDPFVAAANAPGLLLAVFYVLSAVKLADAESARRIEMLMLGMSGLHVVAGLLCAFVLPTRAMHIALYLRRPSTLWSLCVPPL